MVASGLDKVYDFARVCCRNVGPIRSRNNKVARCSLSCGESSILEWWRARWRTTMDDCSQLEPQLHL